MRHPERLDPHRLIYGAVGVVKRFRAWKGQPLWTLVAEITGHGSTYSMEICEDIGFNPHHKIGDPLERRPEPPARPAPETPAAPAEWSRSPCTSGAIYTHIPCGEAYAMPPWDEQRAREDHAKEGCSAANR